jgi:hypothetical protein
MTTMNKVIGNTVTGNIKDLKFENIVSVYSGKKDGGCWCGCAGIHRTSTVSRKAASEERGYAYDDEDVNDSFVRKALRLLQGAIGRLDWEDGCVSAVLGQRVYAIYFSPEWAEKNLTVISPILAVA